ncbi:MAG: hypothetical protein JXB50_09790 [Spirochaetes bacterium]|nr:hypothetical protein [Spirochaetota bacterium]
MDPERDEFDYGYGGGTDTTNYAPQESGYDLWDHLITEEDWTFSIVYGAMLFGWDGVFTEDLAKIMNFDLATYDQLYSLCWQDSKLTSLGEQLVSWGWLTLNGEESLGKFVNFTSISCAFLSYINVINIALTIAKESTLSLYNCLNAFIENKGKFQYNGSITNPGKFAESMLEANYINGTIQVTTKKISDLTPDDILYMFSCSKHHANIQYGGFRVNPTPIQNGWINNWEISVIRTIEFYKD